MKNRCNLLSLVILLFTITTWFGCQKTDSIPPPVNPLEEKVTASVNGRVTDEQGKPVADAQVKSGSSTTSTDINGVFRFSNIQMTRNAGFVMVEKDGYFRTGRTIFTSAGVVNNIEIKLIPKRERGNFQASAGGNISIESGAAVNFPVNGVINENTNAAYSGNVKVFGAYLNPEDPNLASIMPGNLTGLTKENEQKILQTYGMIAVELEGSAGEKLNLAPGKSATLTFPIPSSLQATAPATMPLWYFSDSLGLWKEEGTATKQGNIYTGSVSHFSFWNCDIPGPIVHIKLTLKNQNQKLLAGYKVVLKNTQNNSQAYGYSDSSGSVNGGVPGNVPIEMRVYDKCNTTVHSQTIGPFNTDTDMGTVTITTPGSGNITVSGTVLSCNQAPVANGFVDLLVEGLNYRALVTNGSYSISISRCTAISENLVLRATDNDGNQQGDTVSVNVEAGNYTVNIGACGTAITQFIRFTVGNDIFNFSTPDASISVGRDTLHNSTSMQAYHDNGDSLNFEFVMMNFIGPALPGTHTIGAGFNMTLFRGDPVYLEYLTDNPINVTVTEYGQSGEFIAGNFTANMRERLSNTTALVSCNFRVRRGQ